MPYLDLAFFGFTLWLGAYLLARETRKPAVALTGWGLLAYALALLVQILSGETVLLILLAPALLWIGAALHLLPGQDALRPVLIRAWIVASVPLAILTLVDPWFAALILLALALCAGLIIKLALASRTRNLYALLAVITLFVTLSAGLLILPLKWIPASLAMPLLGFDLLALGLAVTAWDAFDEGETMRAHLLRSFVSALYFSGALALLAGWLGGDLVLIAALIAFGILTQTFSVAIQAGLDRLTLPQGTRLQRQALRRTAETLPLHSPPGPVTADEETFARLTRRALSHLGDLPRLAASPLVNLPGIEGTHPLDRAQALKSLLVRSIWKLKPRSDASFGVSDEWRYYNALYFPYVAGLKPYSRHANPASLDEGSRAALAWFQSSVPERTLHNWQNSAARLIAAEIRRTGLPE